MRDDGSQAGETGSVDGEGLGVDGVGGSGQVI